MSTNEADGVIDHALRGSSADDSEHTVEGAGVMMHFGRHAGLDESDGVGESLVAQRVEVAGRYERGRKPRDVGQMCRGRLGRPRVPKVTEAPNRLDAAVIDAERLGALSALSTVDAAVWERDPRVSPLRELSATENGRIDLAVLEMYLAHGSLRLAGSALHMHHSSVASRLARVEERLGLDLTNPHDVFDARLGLTALTLLESASDLEGAHATIAAESL